MMLSLLAPPPIPKICDNCRFCERQGQLNGTSALVCGASGEIVRFDDWCSFFEESDDE